MKTIRVTISVSVFDPAAVITAAQADDDSVDNVSSALTTLLGSHVVPLENGFEIMDIAVAPE